MKNFNNKQSNYVINDEATLEEAMIAITLNQRGAVVVVDAKGVLLGVVSDGDIRRALLQHATLRAPAAKIINMNVVSLLAGDGVEKRAAEIFKEKSVINIVPVIDGENRVVDIVVRDPEVRKEI